MKKLLAPMMAAILSLTCAWAGTLNIASEEWPPYAYSENGKMTGYCTEIVTAVLGKMGVTPAIRAYPWARAEAMVIAGEADGLYNASRRAKREAACHYPAEQLFDSEYIFFIHKKNVGKLSFDRFDDLKGKMIGVTRAYSYNEEFWNFLKANRNYREAPSDEINFKLLVAGRIDYFPAEKGNGFALIKKMGLADEIAPLEKAFIRKPYFLIFNKKKVDKEFVDRFSDALKAFKATPESPAIQARYFQIAH